MKWFAKKVFDRGGGKRLKNPDNSTCCLLDFLKTPKCFADKFLEKIRNLYEKLTFVAYDIIGGAGSRTIQFIRKRLSFFKKLRLRAANCGSILIEFAICMPILIILLFYIHDLVKLKRYHSQTEFVAQQMANILQNLAKKGASEGRTLSCSDIRYAASLAYLSMFPGTTRFLSKSRTSDFGYNPLGYICCVKGDTDSTASVVWARRFHMADDDAFTPDRAVLDSRINRTNIKNLSNASPSEIYPTLKIAKGETKIILECAIHYSQWDQYFFTDGRCNANVSPSEAFGLRLLKLSPPKTRDGGGNDAIFFHSAVIFSPTSTEFFQTAPNC